MEIKTATRLKRVDKKFGRMQHILRGIKHNKASKRRFHAASEQTLDTILENEDENNET